MRENLFPALIYGRTNKMKLTFWKLICKWLKLTQRINQITLRWILNNFIQPIAALQSDTKTFDCIHSPKSSNKWETKYSHGTSARNELTH